MKGFGRGVKKSRKEDVKEYYKIHVYCLSRQITLVDEEINRALVKGEHIPRKPTQWVKEATALKSQVNRALSLSCTNNSEELQHLCQQIFDYLKQCPVEGKYGDEPITFVAGLHEIEEYDYRKSCSESVQSEEDVAAVAELMSAPLMPASDLLEGGESSQVFEDDEFIPDVSGLDQFEITKEGEASPPYIPSEIQIEEIYESDVEISTTPDLNMPISPNANADDNEVDTSVQISGDLRFEIFSPSSSSKSSVNMISFGLDSERDNYYLFSDKQMEYAIVNRSGGSSKEVATDDEWWHADVANLSGESSLLLNEEPPPDCPNLALLFLQRNNSVSRILPSFFQGMPALRFLDLSHTRISALPASLFKLTDLKVLLLRSCVCLESLPPEVENLINMQVLDLSSTDLYSLPNQIRRLTRLKHLELSFYGSGPDIILSPSVFSELQHLHTLSIAVHPEDQRWTEIAGDVIQHLAKLEVLTDLHFYFPTVQALASFVDLSPSWKRGKLRRFKFVVGHNVKRIVSRVPDEVESEYERSDRCLRFINGSGEVGQAMKRVVKSAKAFYLDSHSDIQDLSEFGIFNLKGLEFCVVRECPNFQVMMIGDKSNEGSAFPNLEHLEMRYLWELERMWEDPVPSGSFGALRYLLLDTCPKLQYVAAGSMLQRLSSLETFVIQDCESLKSIVKLENDKPEATLILLPRLKNLVLRHLPQLATLGTRRLSPSHNLTITLHFCPNFHPHSPHTKDKPDHITSFIMSRLDCGKLMYKIQE